MVKELLLRYRKWRFNRKVERLSNHPVFQGHMNDLKRIMAKHGITSKDSEEDDAKHRTT